MPIPACLILDDFPINGSYWSRAQQAAFGYTPTSGGLFGKNWQGQAKAAFCPVWVLNGFADLVDEFGLKGKFTVLPCPAGLGRIDREIRGFPAGYIPEVLDIIRKRIVPSFDITPEVLSHAMAFDVETGNLLPHVESAWVSYLTASGRHEELAAYLDNAFRILNNVGLNPTGITVGGLPDPSNIAKGELLITGHHRDRFAPILLQILRRFRPQTQSTFMYAYGRPTRAPYETSWLPEPIKTPGYDSGVIYELLTSIEQDPLLEVFHGEGDPILAADALISQDLKTGLFVQTIESGKVLTLTIHAQTITSMNTGLGLRLLRETLKRLGQRYGRELQWMTATELCALSADKEGRL